MENDIILGMARAAYALAWADAQPPMSLAGVEIMDVLPLSIPENFIRWASVLYQKICCLNFLSAIVEPDGADPEKFGHYLAMQALGTGCRWSDSHDNDHNLTIPNVEGPMLDA